MIRNEITYAREVLALLREYLPARMFSSSSDILLISIGLQESRLKHRDQLETPANRVLGPALGLWQFEKGGVWGVVRHKASRFWLHGLCEQRGVAFDADSIWRALVTDDILAAGLARLLVFTDPKKLPEPKDEAGMWDLYMRCWRPGKPHPSTWPTFHATAVEAILGQED